MAGQGYSTKSITVESVPFFSIVGANISTLLKVLNVPGRSLIDRCSITNMHFDGEFLYYQGETRLTSCGELLVQQSCFRGTEACYRYGPATADHAMGIVNFTVAVSDCTLRGGNETGLGCPTHYTGAGSGLEVSNGSDVADRRLDARCGLRSGGGQPPAGNVKGSDIVVRGTSSDYLQPYLPVLTIELDATSTASVSGIVLDPPELPVRVTTPLPTEPCLRATGGEAPDTVLTGDVLGPPGTPVRDDPQTDPAARLRRAAMATPRQHLPPATHDVGGKSNRGESPHRGANGSGPHRIRRYDLGPYPSHRHHRPLVDQPVPSRLGRG